MNHPDTIRAYATAAELLGAAADGACLPPAATIVARASNGSGYAWLTIADRADAYRTAVLVLEHAADGELDVDVQVEPHLDAWRIVARVVRP